LTSGGLYTEVVVSVLASRATMDSPKKGGGSPDHHPLISPICFGKFIASDGKNLWHPKKIDHKKAMSPVFFVVVSVEKPSRNQPTNGKRTSMNPMMRILQENKAQRELWALQLRQ